MSTEAPSVIRAFVALELPGPVRDALGAAIESARGTAPGKLSWSPPEKIHLTLAFLGASEPAKLEALEPQLAAAVSAHPPFPLALGRSGLFPAPKRPNVLWIGLQPSPPLQQLQADVAAAVRALGWELEARPFAPHLTCARVKWPGPPGALAAAWQQLEVPTPRWTADSVTLMKSETHPDGARYTPLATFPLGG